MHLPIYLICAALVITIEAEENDYYNTFAEPLNLIPSERESLNNYLLSPKRLVKYKTEWGRLNPGIYLVTDDVNGDGERLNKISTSETRTKRAELMNRPRGSLSIVSSLDALRNKLVMEIARKKTQQNAERNRQFLQAFGKRSFLQNGNIQRFSNNNNV